MLCATPKVPGRMPGSVTGSDGAGVAGSHQYPRPEVVGHRLRGHGHGGSVAPLQRFEPAQVFADPVIALALAMIRMWRDAPASGRTLWSGIVATVAVGSFGPLFHLLARKRG
jgi:hypothetical protein